MVKLEVDLESGPGIVEEDKSLDFQRATTFNVEKMSEIIQYTP